MKNSLYALVLTAASLCLTLPAQAHRLGTPVTTIEWNEAEAYWEVTHRFSAHDFDSVMEGAIAPSRLYGTPEGLALIEAYVSDKFRVTGPGVQLSFVGSELDGDMVWTYYELTADAPGIMIDSDLLMTARATSHALVNIESADGRASLLFKPDDAAKPARLVPPSP